MRRLIPIVMRRGAGLLMAAVFLTFPARTRANAQSSPADYEALMIAADQAMGEQRLEDAEQQYESIRRAARDNGQALWEARGRLGLGAVERARGQYDRAREDLTAALETLEHLQAMTFVGAASVALGRLEYSLGNDRKSSEYFDRAIAAFDATGNRRERARALFNRLVTSGTDDLATRERQYEALLVEARASADVDFEASILHSWGDQLVMKGEYERASDKLESAAVSASKANDRDQLTTIYTSLGRLYRVHAQPQAAITYQLKALELSEQSRSPRIRVQSLNAVGAAYQSAGDLVKARQYYERALAMADETGSAAIIDFLRAQLGGLLVLTRDAEPARVLLEGVLARGIEQHPATRYSQLSEAYYMLGRFDDALGAAKRGLELCTKDDLLDCVYGHLRIADAELALGHESAALTEEDVALRSIEELHRKLVATDFLKQEFHHFWEPVYSLDIKLHVRRGEFREALETAELARARSFVDLLASHEISSQKQTVPELTALTARRSTTTIRSTAAAEAPSADRLAAVAARLHSTILEYWVAPDALYVWTVAPDGAIQGARVNVTGTKLEELIRSTSPFAHKDEGRRASAPIRSRGNDSISVATRTNPAWSELYNLLVKPIERALPQRAGSRLTIVAHGPLLHLPFAALRDEHGRYLIERYKVHSVPAAAVLEFTTGRRRPNARTGSLLLVADPAAPPVVAGEPALPRLPGSAEEARAIAQLVPSSRTMLLADADATETRVRNAVASRAVVHFATHAIVRDADPMASFLALGRSRDGDGRLTAEKIYGMKLDADLVVLSACRSGDGLVTGDGVAALARAFFYAGAASVVVSVWDVADAPTSRLLPAFYRAWLGGADKASALRTAQLELIRELRAGRVRTKTPLGEIAIPEDPAFWAGFVLLGEPD
jgi:CHAT domain-containing protein/tetratricopeptide (TPR) repeat protein